jgi:hypothetical protein
MNAFVCDKCCKLLTTKHIRGKTDHLSYGTYDNDEKELIRENKIANDNVKYAVHNNSV